MQKGKKMDMETLMAQAQDLQTKISAAQDSLANMTVKGIAENGSVVVSMTGKYDILSVVVAPSTLDLGADKVSQLVADAYKDAKAKADVLIEKTMSSVTGSLSD
nr:YbaB/EbfC family nucleoid-associated protein [Candidatus Enterousia merdequi]